MSEGSCCSTPLLAFVDDVLDFSCYIRCVVVSCFNLHFPDNVWCWESFDMPIFHLYIFFSEQVFYSFFFFFLVFLEPQLWHMEVPSLGVESELQLQAYSTATITWDPNHICDLYHSSWQCRILNSLSEARDWTWVLIDISQILNLLSHNRNSLVIFKFCFVLFCFYCCGLRILCIFQIYFCSPLCTRV